jgi:hypothetical protein
LAPSIVQVKAFTDATTGSFSTATTAGNTVVVAIASEETTNVTMSVSGVTLGGSAGNFAQAKAQQSGFASSVTQFAAIWVDPDCAGGQTALALSGTNLNLVASSDNGWVAFEIAGLVSTTSLAAVLDASAANDATTGTAVSTGTTGATAQASEIAIAALSGDQVLSSFTGSWTVESINDGSGEYNAAAYLILSSTGTQSFAATQSSSGPWAGVIITLKAASGSTPVTLADTAAAADAVALSAAVPLGDTAAASDALSVSASFPLGDTAGAADAMTSGSPVALGDTAAASDALSVAVAVPLSDTAAAADAAANLTPQPGDTAAAADQVTIAAAFGVADTAAASDALSVSAAVPLHDTAAAADARSVPFVTAALHDTAAAADALVTATGGPPTLGGTLPGGGGEVTSAPGYQGGPSGAASVPPSAQGNSWEVYAYSSADYVTLLAVIPTSMLMSFQFARQLDDIGSGTVVLSQDDPWWSAVTLPGGLPAHTLLDEECLWQFRKDGVPRFEFMGETVTEQLVDPSEQRQVTITGPGTIATLKWAMIAPQGFPDIVLKLDGILDSFDEVNASGQGVVDTNIWTTLAPSSHIYITPIANIYSYPGGVGYNLGTLYPSGSLTIEASPSTTYLGASPYDATDTLISAQVTPIGVTASTTDSTTPATYGTGLNGSELTQLYIQSNYDSANYALFGLSGSAFYVQAGSGGSVQTKVLPAYDSTNHAYWMITEQAGSGGGSGTFYFWTSPDGQTWTQQWTYVHSWDATNVTFFVTSTYSVDSTQSVVITNLNSNVTTPSYQGAIYLGVPLMGVWLDQFSQAQARGTIGFVTSLATATGDSYGRAWTDTQNVQAVNGTDLYSLLQSATSVVNADYVMDPGFQLRVGQPATGEVALGVDRSGYIILREGYDAASKQRVRARNQIETLIAGENADGHEISASSPTYIAQWGQREGWFQAAVQVDPTSMAYASAAALAQFETEVLSWTFNLTPNLPGRTIFDDFDVGDWLGLERPDFSAVDPVRVMGIAVQVDNEGAETHELTFVSYIQWLAEQLTYLSNKLGGSFVNALGTTPVAPSRYGTGQVPTYFTPAATLAALADVAPAPGSAIANAPLVYNPNTGQYQHAGTTDPVSGNTVPLVVATPTGTATVTPVQVSVNTGGATSTVGLQGDGTVTQVDTGGSAPGVPDTPLVTGTVQGVNITWDGLLAGVAPLSNFQYIEFHVSTVSGFTPSSSTLQHTQPGQSAIVLTGLTVGTTYYAKLVAVSTAGVTSAPSAQASAVAGDTVPGVTDYTVITGATFVATGTAGEYLAYSGTPAVGNLIMSFAASAGNDAAITGGAGNNYNAGLWVYDSGGNSIGLLSGHAAASQLVLNSGTATPVPPAGAASVFGAGNGGVSVVDGSDANAYGTQRRTLALFGAATVVNNNAWQNIFSSTVAAPSGSARTYRIHGILYTAATTAIANSFNVMWTGPSGIAGQINFIWFSGSGLVNIGPLAPNVRGTPAFTPGAGTYYTCEYDGLVTVAAGTSGAFELQGSATTGESAWTVAANSFIDIMP